MGKADAAETHLPYELGGKSVQNLNHGFAPRRKPAPYAPSNTLPPPSPRRRGSFLAGWGTSPRRLTRMRPISFRIGRTAGPPVVPNGIPLSKIRRAAFDAHLIGIDPDYRLHVSERSPIQKDGPMLEDIRGHGQRARKAATVAAMHYRKPADSSHSALLGPSI